MGAAAVKADRHRYYRVSDRLVENREKIEEHLRQRQGDLFDLDRTVLLYDLTNTHFEGVGAGNAKAKRGKKNKNRDDCVQIVVGMVFDTEGFELGHRIFAGNRSDSTTLLEMIGELDKAVGLPGEREKTLIIMDGGIATEQNVKLLKEERFGYLVNESRRGRGAYREQFLEQEGFEQVQGRDEDREVKVKWLQEPMGEKDANKVEKEQGERGCEDKEYVVLCKSQRRRGQGRGHLFRGRRALYRGSRSAPKPGRSRQVEGSAKDPQSDRAGAGATFQGAALLFD